VFLIAIKSAFPGVACTDAGVMKNTAKPKKGQKQTDMASYSCSASMKLLRLLPKGSVKGGPKEVAATIAKHVPQHPMIGTIDASSPYINIFLSKKYVSAQINKVLCGSIDPPTVVKQKVVVDFSSPNVAKNMHVGHLRSTIIGECISRICEFCGHDVDRVNHIEDWGTQFGMLIANLKDKFPNWKTTAPPLTDLQQFYKESKGRFDEEPDFKVRSYEEVVKLQSGDADVTKAWQLICDVSRAAFEGIYKRLDVTVHEKGESFYQSRMQQLAPHLASLGLLTDCPDGTPRKLFWTTPEDKRGENEIPLLVMKKDGGFGYDTSDMATIRYRIEECKTDWIIYVVGTPQQQHFNLLFAGAERMGMLDRTKTRVDHVKFGSVLDANGKMFKSRSGDTVKLEDLLDEGLVKADEFREMRTKIRAEKGQPPMEMTAEEIKQSREAIAYGSIKYADLVQNREKDYKFSYEKMISPTGNTAIYLLNAYARLQQVNAQPLVQALDAAALAKARKEMEVCVDVDPETGKNLTEQEWKLAQLVVSFPEVIEKAMDELLPSGLCTYLYEMASSVHKFYDCDDCRVVFQKEGKVAVRLLLLIEAVRHTMKTCFDLVGIRVIDKM